MQLIITICKLLTLMVRKSAWRCTLIREARFGGNGKTKVRNAVQLFAVCSLDS